MEVTINQTVKKYEIVVNQTTKQINVNIVSQPKQIMVTISPLGKRGFDGKNAYEVAVANGFNGSELEWIQSLKGEIGIISWASDNW